MVKSTLKTLLVLTAIGAYFVAGSALIGLWAWLIPLLALLVALAVGMHLNDASDSAKHT